MSKKLSNAKKNAVAHQVPAGENPVQNEPKDMSKKPAKGMDKDGAGGTPTKTKQPKQPQGSKGSALSPVPVVVPPSKKEPKVPAGEKSVKKHAKGENGAAADKGSDGPISSKKLPKGRAAVEPTGPEPPKRPQNGFGLFLQGNRPDIVARLKSSGGDTKKTMAHCAKEAGKLWKDLDQADRDSFQGRADAAMAEYRPRLEAFKKANPTWAKKKKQARKRVKKVNKDPDMPKRPLNPYQLFFQENRPAILADLKAEGKYAEKELMPKAGKVAGSMWKSLSAVESEKYKELFAIAKGEFQAKLVAFRLKKKIQKEATEDALSGDDSD